MMRILVIGDLAVDRYLKGKIKGISPEGAYPIVLNPKEYLNLGCAANVANNIKSIFKNIDVHIMSIVGDDNYGRMAKDELFRLGINSSSVLVTKESKTILKSRLVANGQSIARWDNELINNVPEPDFFIKRLKKIAYIYDIILFSDYNKGMVFKKLIETAIENKKKTCKILVDPKKNFNNYENVFLVKPNMKELNDYCDLLENNIDYKCHYISNKYNIEYLLLTKSEDGMTLYSKNDKLHFKSIAKSVVDVTGAGDIVIATIAGYLCNGLPLEECINMSNKAAGVSVQKFGTCTVSKSEIESIK